MRTSIKSGMCMGNAKRCGVFSVSKDLSETHFLRRHVASEIAYFVRTGSNRSEALACCVALPPLVCAAQRNPRMPRGGGSHPPR